MSAPCDGLTRAEQVNAVIEQMSGVFSRNHADNQTLVEPGRSGRRRAPIEPIEPILLDVGMKVKFLGDRRWWTVRAVNPAAVVLTRTAAFSTGLTYTVVVWSEGRRGAHTSWGHEANTDAGCVRIAADIKAGKLELSERHAVRLDLESVR